MKKLSLKKEENMVKESSLKQSDCLKPGWLKLKPGWLGRILKEVENDIRLWPEWMRQEPHLKNLPPMKQLLFGKGLMKPTLAGEKKITIRKYREEA
ncbi:MAG: hypothetical protein Q8N69_03535, partial [bacterium]|nr:hypothetical protein [bacterium]